MIKLNFSQLGGATVYELSSTNVNEGGGLAIVSGRLADMSQLSGGPLVRVHSCCLYGDTLGSKDCDCGSQLRKSKLKIANEKQGIIFYLFGHEGRGAGLHAKMKGYELMQEHGIDTVDAYARMHVPFDQREYGHCARFLMNHDIKHVRLLTNNPRKVESLSSVGISVTQIPIVSGVNSHNVGYLRTKRDKAGHILPIDL